VTLCLVQQSEQAMDRENGEADNGKADWQQKKN